MTLALAAVGAKVLTMGDVWFIALVTVGGILMILGIAGFAFSTPPLSEKKRLRIEQMAKRGNELLDRTYRQIADDLTFRGEVQNWTGDCYKQLRGIRKDLGQQFGNVSITERDGVQTFFIERLNALGVILGRQLRF